MATRADHERAYWDGFRYSLSFGLVPEDTMARDYGDFYETTGDSVDSAFWMGWLAGNIAASGTYAAITAPVGLGMGSVISHSGFILWEGVKGSQFFTASALLAAYFYAGSFVASLPGKTIRSTHSSSGGSMGPYQSFRNPISGM